ncbi:MAG: ComEA family DNA-binding protein [Candidatus Rokuibacteriota bacterium]
MTLYSRRQVVVLLILLAIAGLGLAVGHWRRARPDVTDYLEQLDRAPAPASTPTPPRSEGETAPHKRPGSAPDESAIPRGAPAGPSSGPIDLNRATTLELTRLPGVGPTLARRIVDARDAQGPFARIDDLERVRGMSARRVERLRAFVTVAR